MLNWYACQPGTQVRVRVFVFVCVCSCACVRARARVCVPYLIMHDSPARRIVFGGNSNVARGKDLHQRLAPAIHPEIDDVCMHGFEVDVYTWNC